MANAISALTAIWGQKRWDWLENSNSSVSFDNRKLAQLIGNRQKLETAATSKIFSRQIPQYFSASKVHSRTVPLCSSVEPSPCVPDSHCFFSFFSSNRSFRTSFTRFTTSSSDFKSNRSASPSKAFCTCSSASIAELAITI